MKYVVTGGAGFIGSHIAEELAHHHEVVIVDNFFSGKMENIGPLLSLDTVTLARGTVTDLPFLQETFRGADGIFHQGAIASVPRSIANPVATNEANVGGTLNVLIAARDTGVRKVVFASSSSVYGNTPTLPKREDMALSPAFTVRGVKTDRRAVPPGLFRGLWSEDRFPPVFQCLWSPPGPGLPVCRRDPEFHYPDTEPRVSGNLW